MMPLVQTRVKMDDAIYVDDLAWNGTFHPVISEIFLYGGTFSSAMG
jgi:hypothetical protein